MPSGIPLSPETRAEVLRRLDAGGTLRGVARELGLSYNAVRDCLSRREGTPLRITDSKRPPKLFPGETQLDSPVRCPICGGMTLVEPCRLCAIRESKYGPREPGDGFSQPRRKTA